MVPVEAGTIVGGKYALLRPLGRGSMGEVWVAQHKTLGEEVAIKLLAPAFPGDEYEDRTTAAARFRFEAQIAARLSRKTRHIVRVTDYGDEDGVAYLVMELLVGRTLEMFFMQYGSMTIEAASGLVRQVARALEHAHAESVVHRDLKPANLFVTHDEDGGMLIKVLDFGIARTMRTQRVSIPSAFSTGQGLIFGTPGYMSPEQARAARMDARTDLWAFATVIYEALTGELPLDGGTADDLVKNLCAGVTVPVHQRDPNLPAGLADFFARAFAPNIDDRFATAPELAGAFERALHTAPPAMSLASVVCSPALPVAMPPVASLPTLVSGSSVSAAAVEHSTWTAAGTLEMPRVKTGPRVAAKPASEPPPVAAPETSPWPRRAMVGAAFAALAVAGLFLPARYASQHGPAVGADAQRAQHVDVGAGAGALVGAPQAVTQIQSAERPGEAKTILSPLSASAAEAEAPSEAIKSTPPPALASVALPPPVAIAPAAETPHPDTKQPAATSAHSRTASPGFSGPSPAPAAASSSPLVPAASTATAPSAPPAPPIDRSAIL